MLKPDIPAMRPCPHDPLLDSARVDVELLDASGQPFSPPRFLEQDARLALHSPGFRYRVWLRPTAGWTEDELIDHPVLQTPVFDDITFTYVTVGGPRIFSWEQP